MHRFISAVLLVLAVAAIPGVAVAQSTKPADDSVYQAWGQKEGIHVVMEDFFTRLQADSRTGPFFKHANHDRLVMELTDQLCYESGGPCVYTGIPMGVRHAGMNITKNDFNALVEVLQKSMDAKGIPFWAQNKMLARLAPMHREIITKE